MLEELVGGRIIIRLTKQATSYLPIWWVAMEVVYEAQCNDVRATSKSKIWPLPGMYRIHSEIISISRYLSSL